MIHSQTPMGLMILMPIGPGVLSGGHLFRSHCFGRFSELSAWLETVDMALVNCFTVVAAARSALKTAWFYHSTRSTAPQSPGQCVPKRGGLLGDVLAFLQRPVLGSCMFVPRCQGVFSPNMTDMTLVRSQTTRQSKPKHVMRSG